MNVRSIKTRIFAQGEDLFKFIVQHLPKLKDNSILAITSKIVALSEGRVAEASKKEGLIKRESSWALQAYKDWWWTERDEMLLVNAGIDESNSSDGKIVLLPEDSFSSASSLRANLMKHYGIKKLGIVITDSRISPMRAGVTGIALGYAGFRGVRDYRGKPDIFGRKLKVTQTNIADSLATVAILVMGEGAERCPLALLENPPVEFIEKTNRKELLISPKKDMYRPLFKRAVQRRKRRRV